MLLQAIAFDSGHTLMDERRDEHIPMETRPIHLMPGVAHVLPQATLPLAVGANTRVARETTSYGLRTECYLLPKKLSAVSQADSCRVTSIR